MAAECSHTHMILITTTDKVGCEDCLKMGDTWKNLRLCVTCGYVGCCDESKNTHATKHFQATGHPVMQSLKPGDNWRWCYVDQVKFSTEENV